MPERPETAVRRLYADLLTAWNGRNATDFAELFSDDGLMVGFDGSQVPGTEVFGHLAPIFADHPTAAYVAKVRGVRAIAPTVYVLHAIVGMVPPGKDTLMADRNAIQVLLAQERDGRWLIELFQNTPAKYDGRPELAWQHTEELEPMVSTVLARVTS
jgi:uncharacterized protein (TIGR02246 family)